MEQRSRSLVSASSGRPVKDKAGWALQHGLAFSLTLNCSELKCFVVIGFEIQGVHCPLRVIMAVNSGGPEFGSQILLVVQWQGRTELFCCRKLLAKELFASHFLPVDVISKFTRAVGITTGFGAAGHPVLTPGPWTLTWHLAKQLIPALPYDVLSENCHGGILASSCQTQCLL